MQDRRNTMSAILRLPRSLQRILDAAVDDLLNTPSVPRVDFTSPRWEEALVSANSISWRIFKNPIALFIGGVAAVVLELAEPSVRAGVWEHSTFLKDPAARLRRTGLAAMVTVYGARSVAQAMIGRVTTLHASVQGQTAAGVRYSATDPRLLVWVQATASFSFAEAYSRYVEALSPAEFNAFHAEGEPSALLYGAVDAPRSVAGMRTLFDAARCGLNASPIVFELLTIMRQRAMLPGRWRWLQPVLVRAAIDIVPAWIRERLGLDENYGLRAHERWLVRAAGGYSNRIVLPQSPAVKSCLRLGLPITYLYE